MDRDEAEEKVKQMRGLFVGHPPRDPFEIIELATEIISGKKRKAKTGITREEKGGFDRQE